MTLITKKANEFVKTEVPQCKANYLSILDDFVCKLKTQQIRRAFPVLITVEKGNSLLCYQKMTRIKITFDNIRAQEAKYNSNLTLRSSKLSSYK